ASRPSRNFLLRPPGPLRARAGFCARSSDSRRSIEKQCAEMIVDVHTHFFRPELDFAPRLWADMKRCGVEPTAWGDLGERHWETTRAADVAIVFGLRSEE